MDYEEEIDPYNLSSLMAASRYQLNLQRNLIPEGKKVLQNQQLVESAISSLTNKEVFYIESSCGRLLLLVERLRLKSVLYKSGRNVLKKTPVGTSTKNIRICQTENHHNFKSI